MPDQDTPSAEVDAQLAQQRIADVTSHLPQPSELAPFKAHYALKTAPKITELRTTYAYNVTKIPLALCIVYVEGEDQPRFFVYSERLSDGSPKVSFNNGCLITVSLGTTNVWVPLEEAVLSDEYKWRIF